MDSDASCESKMREKVMSTKGTKWKKNVKFFFLIRKRGFLSYENGNREYIIQIIRDGIIWKIGNRRENLMMSLNTLIYMLDRDLVEEDFTRLW